MKAMEWVDNAVAVKNAAGAILVNDKHVADTLQCVHCSAHWIVVKGSGKKRGWCMKCKGYICGSPLCDDACIPLWKRLEGWETGKTKITLLKELDSRPVIFLSSGVAIGG